MSGSSVQMNIICPNRLQLCLVTELAQIFILDDFGRNQPVSVASYCDSNRAATVRGFSAEYICDVLIG